MELLNLSAIIIEKCEIESEFLKRSIKVDFYCPKNVADPSSMSLLFINDGQNMEDINFETILETLYTGNEIEPLLCVAIHANEERKMEYGMASHPDYLGRGAKAGLFTSFVLKELLPFVRSNYLVYSFKEKAFAGFSLGGLTALDIVWNHPAEFSKVGVFSGSLWWRAVNQDAPEYDDNKHRLMHQQIGHGDFYPWLKFFFQCGNMDETKDRNKNGIIDSIDDTLDLVKELKEKGYADEDIYYLEMKTGRHDMPTWAKAMPVFLKWGWGKK